MNMKLKTLLLAVCTLTATATVISGCGRKPNTLTSAEKADGWQLLFDGETLDGWRDYNGDSARGASWTGRSWPKAAAATATAT